MAKYTQLDEKNLDHLLGHYDLGSLEKAVPLEGGQANSSVQLTTARGRFTLSVCDEKSFDEIDCLTRVLAFLETREFPTTRLILTSNGQPYVPLADNPVYIKEYIQGETCKALDKTMLEQVGNAMARLHQLPPPPGLPRAFPYGLTHFDELLTSGLTHPFIPWLKNKKKWLNKNLDPAMAKGFIHGDLFWDNLLFNGNTLGAVLDFEEACQYYLLYDIAMASVGCCAAGNNVKGGFNMDKMGWLVRGYQKAIPLSAAEKVQLKPFIVYAATAAAFWRFRQYNIRYPSPDNIENYKELASLADQSQTMDLSEFMMIFAP